MRVQGWSTIRLSTGCERSTFVPTSFAKMSRSVRTPLSLPDWSVTKTESPTPICWISARQSASVVPGRTVSGSRRLRLLSFSSASDGTRAATARSVISVTFESVVR